ncbi:hypothetical protein WN944_025500 [Citrus x changshan-huyou]|uniref:C2 domain-containing protein n=1 Tax=Citrus x changshan-huyou TaxID=2935761 RepID=A0AAP0LQI3_9ROSI
MGVYAVVSISGDHTIEKHEVMTHVDRSGGSNPTWNFPIKFTFNESLAQQNRLTLNFKIKRPSRIASLSISRSKATAYSAIKPSANTILTVYHPPPPPPLAGYVYLPPPPLGYGYPPPPPQYRYEYQVPVKPPKKSNGGLGAGLLRGMLGGLLIGDIVSDAVDYDGGDFDF